MKQLLASGLACAIVTPAFAAEPVTTAPIEAAAVAPATSAPNAAPLLVVPVQQQTMSVLPANTELTLSMNQEVSTKGKRWNEGDTFDLTVTHNVMLGNYVVIPRGSRGVGRITWLTNKGAFGKSGKMEIDLEYVEAGGRRIPISGHYRQEGEGNTVGTVAGVVAVGLFAGFVTGKSGRIPQGRELTARTKEDLPIAFAGPAPVVTSAPIVAQPLPAQPAAPPVAAPTSTPLAPATVQPAAATNPS
jgi:hypothetical protein